LHLAVHTKDGNGVPPQKKLLEQNIEDSKELTQDKKRAVIQYLKTLPAGNNLCQGELSSSFLKNGYQNCERWNVLFYPNAVFKLASILLIKRDTENSRRV
jgi:hypothetical protein